MTTNYSIKNEDLKETKYKNAFHTLVHVLKDNFKDCEEIQLTNNHSGNFYSPSQKHKSFRLGTPNFNPDQFKDLSDAEQNFTLITIAFKHYRPYLKNPIIKMKLEPTEKDIGRKVKYVKSWMKPEQIEFGIITSFNNSHVHVRYGNDNISKATRREDLRWENE